KTKIETTKAHSGFSSSHAGHCGPPLLFLLLLLGWPAPARAAATADCAAPSFAAARTFDTGTSDTGLRPRSVAVGDFNGDGKPDLAVANLGFDRFSLLSGNVSVVLGKGDGTFQAAVSYFAGSLPSSVAVGDFNGDGKPDLAVANRGYDPSSG